MIAVYNILNDNNNKPILNIQRELDIEISDVSIEESVGILNEYFDMEFLNVEHAYLIGFDNRMNITGIFLISIGTSQSCYFYKKSIAMFLLLSGTEKFALYHNHPDGNLNVSTNDNVSLYAIKSLSDILEVEFIDSVIISRNGWRCIEKGVIVEYDEEDYI